jgi:hypothetical protein
MSEVTILFISIAKVEKLSVSQNEILWMSEVTFPSVTMVGVRSISQVENLPMSQLEGLRCSRLKTFHRPNFRSIRHKMQKFFQYPK